MVNKLWEKGTCRPPVVSRTSDSFSYPPLMVHFLNSLFTSDLARNWNYYAVISLFIPFPTCSFLLGWEANKPPHRRRCCSTFPLKKVKSKQFYTTLCRYILDRTLEIYVRTSNYDKEYNPSEKLVLWRKDQQKREKNETENRHKQKARNFIFFFLRTPQEGVIWSPWAHTSL